MPPLPFHLEDQKAMKGSHCPLESMPYGLMCVDIRRKAVSSYSKIK